MASYKRKVLVFELVLIFYNESNKLSADRILHVLRIKINSVFLIISILTIQFIQNVYLCYKIFIMGQNIKKCKLFIFIGNYFSMP